MTGDKIEEIEQKSSRAESLRVSKLFQEFYQEAVDDAVRVFVNADASADEIGEAHAIIRALTKLKSRMDRATSQAKVARKRRKD